MRALRFLGVLMALALVGCGVDDDASQPVTEPDGRWMLVEGEGPDGEIPLVEGAEITLEVEGQDWSGTAACNSYHATVEVEDGALTVHEVVHTEIACPQQGVMEAEAAYLDAFSRVEAFERGDDALELTGSGVRLVYEPA